MHKSVGMLYMFLIQSACVIFLSLSLSLSISLSDRSEREKQKVRACSKHSSFIQSVSMGDYCIEFSEVQDILGDFNTDQQPALPPKINQSQIQRERITNSLIALPRYTVGAVTSDTRRQDI
jgi:hypothetical protein